MREFLVRLSDERVHCVSMLCLVWSFSWLSRGFCNIAQRTAHDTLAQLSLFAMAVLFWFLLAVLITIACHWVEVLSFDT